MGITIKPAVPARYSRQPIEGKWEPKKYQEQAAAQQAQKEKTAKDRQNIQKIIAVVVIVMIISFVVPFLMPGNTSCDTCFVTSFIIFVMMAVFLWIFYAATGVDQAANANMPYFYPTVEIRMGNLYLDGTPVNYKDVAVCQLDRVLDEFRIIANDWKRRVIYLRYYSNPDALAEALRRNFEDNGKKVELRGVQTGTPPPVQAKTVRYPMEEPEEPEPEAKQEEVWSVEPMHEVEYQAQVDKNLEEVAPEAPKPFKEPVVEMTEPEEPMEEPEIQIEPSPQPVITQPVDNEPRCRNCGAKLSEDLIECPNCGTAI